MRFFNFLVLILSFSVLKAHELDVDNRQGKELVESDEIRNFYYNSTATTCVCTTVPW